MQMNPESAAVEAVAWRYRLNEKGNGPWGPGPWGYETRKPTLTPSGFYDLEPLVPQSALDALRGEVERLRTELSARGDYVNEALIARADAAERRVAELEAVLGAVVADPTWRTSDNTLWPRLTNALRQEKPE